jgi:hypothetical protein
LSVFLIISRKLEKHLLPAHVVRSVRKCFFRILFFCEHTSWGNRTCPSVAACFLVFVLLAGCTALPLRKATPLPGEVSAPADAPAGGGAVPGSVAPATSAQDNQGAHRSRVPDHTAPVSPPPQAESAGSSSPERQPVISRGDISYENATITEDVTWNGSVLVRGYLVIAPQATVRIEPGTVVRFMRSPILRQAPRLVVMGRLDCDGAPGRPVLFTPNVADAGRGDWGGILLLSSEKRNQLDHVRIEGAATGIEADFSTLSGADVSITRCTVGMLLRDSSANLTRAALHGCETGLEALDSEVDLRDSALNGNRRGITSRRTTLVLRSVSLRENEQSGITAADCRIRLASCQVVANGGGVRLGGGEGEVTGTRFVANRGVGLDLMDARVKVHRNLFAETAGDGIRVSDGRSLIWGNSFEDNHGYNLALTGPDRVIAVGNWWGSAMERSIAKKLLDAAKDSRSGQILFFPWLPEKPAELP